MEKKKYIGSFILGAVAGALIFGAATRSFPWCKKWDGQGRNKTERILQRLEKKLDLTAQQKDQVQKILEANRAKLQALHEETWPKFKAIHGEFKSEVKPLLNQTQQAEFDKIVERFDQRMERCATKYKN